MCRLSFRQSQIRSRQERTKRRLAYSCRVSRLQVRQRQDAQQSQKTIQNGCSTFASVFRPAIPRARSEARQVRGRLRSAWHRYVDERLALALLEETAWGAVSL